MTFTILRASTWKKEDKKTFTTIKELKDYFKGESIVICWADNEIIIYDDYIE
jgi:hypothetical protein